MYITIIIFVFKLYITNVITNYYNCIYYQLSLSNYINIYIYSKYIFAPTTIILTNRNYYTYMK